MGGRKTDNKGAIQGETATKNFSILLTNNHRDWSVLYIVVMGIQPLSRPVMMRKYVPHAWVQRYSF